MGKLGNRESINICNHLSINNDSSSTLEFTRHVSLIFELKRYIFPSV